MVFNLKFTKKNYIKQAQRRAAKDHSVLKSSRLSGVFLFLSAVLNHYGISRLICLNNADLKMRSSNPRTEIILT